MLQASRFSEDCISARIATWAAEFCQVLQAGSGEDVEERPSRETDPKMELQVTFGGGLDQLKERLEAKREEGMRGGKDTLWEAYLRRRK